MAADPGVLKGELTGHAYQILGSLGSPQKRTESLDVSTPIVTSYVAEQAAFAAATPAAVA
jgi:hypothetical protein